MAETCLVGDTRVDANRRITILYEAARAALGDETLPTVVHRALTGLAELVPCWQVAFGVLDDAQGVFVILGSVGRGATAVPSGLAVPLSMFNGDLGRLRRGEVDRFTQGSADAGAIERLLVPAIADGTLVGTFQLVRRDEDTFTDPDVAVAIELSRIVASALRSVRLRQELVRAHDEAMAGLRAKDAFLAQASHELRSPLHAILGYIGLLVDEEDDRRIGDVRRDLERVGEATNHLRALVDDLLDLTRAGASPQAVALEPVHVPKLLRELDATARPLVEAGGNRWRWACPDDAHVVGDALRLRQVLLNLVGNAARFTHAGDVSVQVEPAVGGWCIAVRDTGAGIPAHKLGTLFDPFTQAHDPRLGVGGTGLGLAISDRYVRRMGGKIRVDSEEGVGSTFRVLLNAA